MLSALTNLNFSYPAYYFADANFLDSIIIII